MTDTTTEDRLREAVKAAIRTLSKNTGDQLTSHTMSALESLGAVLGAEIREDRAAAASIEPAPAGCGNRGCTRRASRDQLYCSHGCAVEDAYEQVVDGAPMSETDLGYGPQTALIRPVLETLRTMTSEDAMALEDYEIPDYDVLWREARWAVLNSFSDREQARRYEVAKQATRTVRAPRPQTREVNPVDRALSFAELHAFEIIQALMLRDTALPEHYDIVTRPWRTLIGRIHPDDAEIVAV